MFYFYSFGSPYCLGNDEVILPLVQLTKAIGWSSMQQPVVELLKMSPVCQHSRWAKFLKELYEEAKDDLVKDISFKSMVACLVEKFETQVRDKQLETDSADPWAHVFFDQRSVDARVQDIAVLLFLVDDEELLKKFTSAVCVHSRRSPQSSLLKNLVESLSRGKLGDNPFWIELVDRRIQQLEEVEKVGIPPFSWNQEDAVVAGHPRVESFLRGPETRMSYQAFNSVRHARNWMDKHFHKLPWMLPYSAMVTIGGRGRDAYASIVKTRDWYDRKVNTIKEQLSELEKLRGMVKSQPVAGTASPLDDQMEPQIKKKAV